MLVTPKEVGEQMAPLTPRQREHAKSEIEYIDRSSVV